MSSYSSVQLIKGMGLIGGSHMRFLPYSPIWESIQAVYCMSSLFHMGFGISFGPVVVADTAQCIRQCHEEADFAIFIC